MKKIFKSLLVLSIFTLSFLVFTACDKKVTVKSIYVDLGDQTSITVAHKSDWRPEKNLSIKAKLSNGKEKEVDLKDCTFVGFNINNVGVQEVTIAYSGCKTTLSVEVEKVVLNYTVKEGSIASKVEHYSGNGKLDTSNAVLVVSYSDGSSGEISEGIEFGESSTLTVGKKSLNITYKGVQKTFSYTVERILTAIKLNHDSYEKEVSWNKEPDTYSYEGLEVYAVYSDGAEDKITDYTLSKKVTTNITNNLDFFTVSYKGKTVDSQKIKVYASVIEVEYVSGLVDEINKGEPLDISNVTIKAYFNDGTEKLVNNKNDTSIFSFPNSLNQVDKDNDFDIIYNYDKVASPNANRCTKIIFVKDYYKGNFIVSAKTNNSIYFVTSSTPSDDEIKANFNFFEDWMANDKVITDLSLIKIESVSKAEGGADNEYIVVFKYSNSQSTQKVSIFYVSDLSEIE